MNVEQLINILSAYPKEFPVVVEADEGYAWADEYYIEFDPEEKIVRIGGMHD
jgi:hypothetical protein